MKSTDKLEIPPQKKKKKNSENVEENPHKLFVFP